MPRIATPEEAAEIRKKYAVDPEVAKRVRERIAAKEVAEGARFPGGRPFPIPSEPFDV